MLVALGSFAYKYYSIDPTNPQAKAIENAIIILLEKIQISMLKIEVFGGIYDSKLVHGELLVSSYEFAKDENDNNIVEMTNDGKKLVKTYKTKRVIKGGTPNTVLILKPTSGPSLHSFRCLSKTAVFMDILGPPYNDSDRNCTYYEDENDLGEADIPTLPEVKEVAWLTVAPHLEFPCYSRPYDLKNSLDNI